MTKWLDFNNQEKNYVEMQPTVENLKKCIGKQICYIRASDVDTARRYCFTRSGIVKSVSKRIIVIEDSMEEIEISKIMECGVRKEEPPVLQSK